MSTAEIPRRGAGRARTSERRAQLVRAAGTLFRRRGFAGVSMQDISAAVGMSGSSIYRHFPSKQALLHEAIESGLAAISEAVDSSDSFDEICDAIAAATIDRPDFWILLRRESRHLEAGERAWLFDRASAIVERAVAELASSRHELTATEASLRASAALACAVAPSQYPRHVAPDVEAVQSAWVAKLAARAPRGIESTGWDAPSRRTGGDDGEVGRRGEILSAAQRLISHRGYQSVSLNEIGAAAGIAGPSLYHHFSGKPEVLSSILNRGADQMESLRTHALRSGDDPTPILSRLATSYAEFAIENAEAFRIFVNDSMYLPARDFARIDALHRQNVATWTVLAEMRASRDDPIDPQQRVSCALSIINEFVTTRPSAELRASLPEMTGVILWVLGLRDPASS